MLLYYFPGKKNEDITDDYLDSVRLGHLKKVELKTGEVIQNGPDGTSGTIKTPKNTNMPFYVEVKMVGYYPNSQTWVKCGDIYIGYENDNKPFPEGLQRRKNVTGYFAETDFGKFIVSPKRFMPSTITMSDNDEITYKPVEECGPTIELLDLVLQDELSTFDGKESKISISEKYKLAAMALGVNYLVGIPECNALRLVNTDNLIDIVRIVLDIDAIVEMMTAINSEKKNADDLQCIEGSDEAK